MIKVVIIEDELPAARKLKSLLEELKMEVVVQATLDSVEESVKWFNTFPHPDLVFMDIQLADGVSFEIFQQLSLQSPVIFTTAYDQYMLKAFKHNGIEYLLKPFNLSVLSAAMEKFKMFCHHPQSGEVLHQKVAAILESFARTTFKERFMVKKGQQIYYLNATDIANLYVEGKLIYATDFEGKKHMLDGSLTELEPQLSAKDFYRVNRHLIVNIRSIKSVIPWFSGRLKLEISPQTMVEAEVSRDRVSKFKEWLGA
ncbi:LytR/AlgR family response regulator transcription factor [Chitinophaga defluvii]|uniref:LytTR family DNA-binding domain-containing protein n=1 Tax=Chitinophaga defluvii TaxID=3163343 RepID=A0ABV2TB44_9BACT